MKKSVKRIALALFVVVVAAYAGYTLTRPVAVQAEQVTLAPLIRQVQEEAVVEAADRWSVYSMVAGEVLELLVEEGDQVRAGDPLLRIDTAALNSQIERLRLTREAAAQQVTESTIQRQYQLLQLQLQLEELKETERQLFDKERGSAAVALISARNAYRDAEDAYEQILSNPSSDPYIIELYRQAYQAAEDAYNVAKANISRDAQDYYISMQALLQEQMKRMSGAAGAPAMAAASLKEMDKALEYLTSLAPDGVITAPRDGVVRELFVGEGDAITEFAPVCTMYAPALLELEVYALAEDSVLLTPGQEARLTRTGDTNSYSGRVLSVAPSATEQLSSLGLSERRVKVRITPQQLPKGYGPGFTLDADFAIEVAPATITVPTSALLPQGDGYAVYLVRNGKAVLQPVTVGLRASGRAQLLDGVAKGDVVITTPTAEGLRDGASVAIY